MRARILVPVLAVLVALACIRLGFWQLGKHRARQASNQAAAAELRRPVATVNGSVPPAPYRRVRAVGRWDPAHEILLRQQTLQGVPGVTLVTPFVLDHDGRTLLVVRGFVPTPDGMWAPEVRYPVAGADTVSGTVLNLPEARGDGRPLTRQGITTWAGLDRSALVRQLGSGLLPVYLVESGTPEGGALPRRLLVPPLDDGPFLSYTIQWFSFATVALVGAVLWSRRQHRGPEGPRLDPTEPRRLS